MTYRTNIAAGGALALFAAVYIYLSGDIQPFKGIGATPLDARFIPRLWGTALLILSLMLVVRGFRARTAELRGGAAGSGVSAKSFWDRNREVVLTFAAIAVYTALLGPVGFLIMSALYMFFQILLLSKPEKRNYKLAAAVAVISAVLVDYLFVELLSVLLPRGILGF